MLGDIYIHIYIFLKHITEARCLQNSSSILSFGFFLALFTLLFPVSECYHVYQVWAVQSFLRHHSVRLWLPHHYLHAIPSLSRSFGSVDAKPTLTFPLDHKPFLLPLTSYVKKTHIYAFPMSSAL